MSTNSNASSTTNSVVFVSHTHQILSTLLHLIGCSVLAACLSRRFTYKNINLAKLCITAIFADSWLFVFSAGLVVNGVGMSMNLASCLSGIYLCIFFYASSKVLIYLFLAEKVYIVWSSGKAVGRFKSRVWLTCLFVMAGYIAIFILMLIARIAYLREDRTCVIGLRNVASIPLLAYDFFLNCFLTGLFIWPLCTRRFSTGRLERLARKTCWAATVALTTSVVNILVLTILHGHQLGWVCLASCGLDVTINAIAIFAVSQNNDNAPTFDGESPEDPTPAEKSAFGKIGSQASVFKLKGAVSEQATHRSAGNASGVTCALARANCSNASITSEYRLDVNLFDYLPKDQAPSLECQETVLKSAGDVAAHSLFNVESHPVVHSQESQRTWAIRKGGMGEVSTHQYRRGSRGLLAELSERFGKASPVAATAEDLAIEVRLLNSKIIEYFFQTDITHRLPLPRSTLL
ncbi:hypothetical protein CPB86DRAFT_508416 [Serendipita vermifera]|nr:hypothetical protein CPB86DRAFT_508416 [Serendipita vermifera]